jgi:lysozyme
MGVSGVLKFKGMLEALKAGKRELAANEALDSLWARQTPERARRVAEQIRG